MLIDHDQPIIMGILNITPDSFSDGGHYLTMDNALNQVRHMLAEGADIIDIGGESTRPGSDPVNADEQIARILPVIKAIREQVSSVIPLSVDTTQAKVALAAFEAGANWLNDVSAGRDDPNFLSLAAERGNPIVLMHAQGTPKTMQDAPQYAAVVQEVKDFLKVRIDTALSSGVKAEQIILDPGIGFGKRKEDNLKLLANLHQLTSLGFPIMLGTSRKRFMGNILTVQEPQELVTATAATTALGVMAGVKIFRVHDVKANKHAAQVAYAIKQAGKSN